MVLTFLTGDLATGFLIATFLTGALAIGFLATAFLIGALATVLISGLAITFATCLVFLLPRYFESSNARIGMKITLRNTIPSPYVQCFQNFSAM